MSGKSRWQVELERVRAAHKGRLHPRDVVDAARDPQSALHSKFTWDDTEAAAKYRLEQAKQLIQIVTVKLEGSTEAVRAYVSLSSDRLSRGGFRALIDVLSDDQLLGILIEDARQELVAFERRFERLRKIARFKPLMREVRKVTRKRGKAGEDS